MAEEIANCLKASEPPEPVPEPENLAPGFIGAYYFFGENMVCMLPNLNLRSRFPSLKPNTKNQDSMPDFAEKAADVTAISNEINFKSAGSTPSRLPHIRILLSLTSFYLTNRRIQSGSAHTPTRQGGCSLDGIHQNR